MVTAATGFLEQERGGQVGSERSLLAVPTGKRQQVRQAR